ncbi:30S ribosomal protein S4 [Candidatus Peregrinibacteria bacterium]|jgi:small subunit ribosomal protein S4|nr:30S ribosomal protein S4 [Candidatus Peregrinibacteria bacterium]
MGRYLGSKVKICKRVGANIYGNPKYDAILAKKKAKKGFSKKPSEYSLQLKEKQLARYMFGVSEKQFKKYFQKAYRNTGVTGTELLKNLELRADNVVYRSGVADSRPQARQMISHGHFELNGRRITVPSISIRAGDTLVLRKKIHSSPLYVGFSEAKPLKWIKTEAKNKSITLDRIPENDELEQSINVQLIVEYYSR